MNFQPFTSGGVTYTAAQQAAAWDAYISQDSYLSKQRGQYAERNGVLLPMVYRLDFSVARTCSRTSAGPSTRYVPRRLPELLEPAATTTGASGRLVGMNTSGPYATSRSPTRRRRPGPGDLPLRVVNGALINQSLQPTAV